MKALFSLAVGYVVSIEACENADFWVDSEAILLKKLSHTILPEERHKFRGWLRNGSYRDWC